MSFGDGAGGAKASLVVPTGAIGTVSALTIAGRFRVPTAALAVDQQNLFAQQTPLVRVMYRYTSSKNSLRFEVGAPSAASVDLDLPDSQEIIDAILTVSGNTEAKLTVGATSARLTLPGQQTISALAPEAHAATATSWRGWIGEFGIWKMAPTATLQG